MSFVSFQKKRKISSSCQGNRDTGLGPTASTTTTTSVGQVYNFDEHEDSIPGHKQQKTPTGEVPSGDNQLHSHVSVNIVQKINTQSSAASKIELTVSSTVHTGGAKQPPPPSQSTDTTAASASATNVCKQEPEDTHHRSDSPGTSQSPFPDILKEDLDNFFSQLPDDVLREIYDNPSLGPDTRDEQDYKLTTGQGTPGGSSSDTSKTLSEGEHKDQCSGPQGGMFADPVYNVSSPNGPSVSTSSTNSRMGGQNPMAGPGYPPKPPSAPQAIGAAQPPPPGPPSILDTGPAAETLKQMAAQHQNQEYNMKQQGMPPHLGNMDSFPRHSGYNAPYPVPGQNYQTNGGMYPGYNNHMGSMPGPADGMMPSPVGPAGNPKGEPPGYGATKPLSHFTEPTSASTPTPSSLQQLQNQVQSQLSQAPIGNSGAASAGGVDTFSNPSQMQLKQSQQLQFSQSGAGSGQFQISQTQHMQIQGSTPQQISLGQQQTFSMSQGGIRQPGPPPSQGQPPPPHYVPENMRMRMYNNSVPDMDQHSMQQYIARQGHPPSHPPPEYKMPNAGVDSRNYPSSYSRPNSGNPLQTIQNMVNQTNRPPGPQEGMYHTTVKSEMPGGQALPPGSNQAMPGPGMGMPNMPQGPGSIPPGSNRVSPGVGGPSVSMPPSFPPQQASATPQSMRPPVCSAASKAVSSSSAGTKPSGPMYTSAIMRGQRPPNVNVGPDGLNISHQRNPADWPRHGMMGHAGPQVMGGAMTGPPAPHPGMVRHNMPQSSMMQYNGPGGYPGGHPGMGMMGNRMAMSQQQVIHMAQQSQPGMLGGPQQGMPHPGQGPHPGAPPAGPGPHMHASSLHMAQQQQHMSMQQNGYGQTVSMTQTAMASATSHPPTPQSQTHPPNYPTGPGMRPHPATGSMPQQQQRPPPQASSNRPPTAATGPEFPLDFLDNTSTPSNEFFDSVVQNTNASDLNFINDILGEK